MSNIESNYPTNQANKALNGQDFTGQTVSNIMELWNCGKPQTTAQLEDRIVKYFTFCQERKTRPGIEGLCLSLGVSRQAFWKWCNKDCGKPEWVELCRQARQGLVAFLESCLQSGHLAPPVGIFLLKNIGNYKDTLSFEDLNPTIDTEETMNCVVYPDLSGKINESKYPSLTGSSDKVI